MIGNAAVVSIFLGLSARFWPEGFDERSHALEDRVLGADCGDRSCHPRAQLSRNSVWPERRPVKDISHAFDWRRPSATALRV